MHPPWRVHFLLVIMWVCKNYAFDCVFYVVFFLILMDASTFYLKVVFLKCNMGKRFERLSPKTRKKIISAYLCFRYKITLLCSP